MKIFKEFLPFLLGFVGLLLVGMFIMGDTSLYQTINKPSIAPPSYVFGIVWAILYLLMLGSLFLLFRTDSQQNKKPAYFLFFTQLLVNIIWPTIFFQENQFLLAFFWILLLLFLILWTTKSFYEINKISAYLQIPYILWVIFAGILNFLIYRMN